MKYLVLLAVLLSSFAVAECVKPKDFMFIDRSMEFCSDTFDVPNGIHISADNVVLDCKTAILRGTLGVSETGIIVENVKNVTIRNCQVLTFRQGLYLKNVTHSLFEKNNFFKNKVGVRMLYAYENVLRDNNDKSLEVPVSAIMSKYNTVLLGNKDIDRSFCEVNACNKPANFNLCESGDFYCSPSCVDSDLDCQSSFDISKVELPDESDVEKIDERIVEETSGDEEIKKSDAVKIPKKEVEVMTDKRSVPLLAQLVLYLAGYVLAFVGLRLFRR
jgi:parallel beta-helix repeat protein